MATCHWDDSNSRCLASDKILEIRWEKTAALLYPVMTSLELLEYGPCNEYRGLNRTGKSHLEVGQPGGGVVGVGGLEDVCSATADIK